MGESFIIVNLIQERDPNFASLGNPPSTKLRLKLFGGPSTGEVFYFRPDPATPEPSSVIKIGRSNACQVVIEDAVLSKLQAHIYFSHEKDCWVLEDGSPGPHHKHSLNGTWLYLNEDFEVYECMTFKVNQVLFQANIMPC